MLVHGQPRLGMTAFSQLLELAAAIDARYRIAPAHSRKVARLSRDLAIVLELEPDAVAASYLGGLLHALGTLPLDESALRPHGALTALDAKLELHHGTRGAELVGPDPVRSPRRPDPGQLRGALGRIWPAARPRGVDPVRGPVVAVANAIVTMTEPGGDALPLTSSLTEIWRLAGGRYDPEVVSALFRLVRDGRIAEVLEEGSGVLRGRAVLEPELLRDHHALHLVRALADLEDLLVAVKAGDRVLVHEAVAAVDLERPVRRPVRELARCRASPSPPRARTAGPGLSATRP